MLICNLSQAVSNDAIDNLYARARRAGAVGGKLLGAGGDGFLILYVEPDKQRCVLDELDDLLYVPFDFETGGTQVIYYSSEDYELPNKFMI